MVHIYSLSVIDNANSEVLHVAHELSEFSFWKVPSIKKLCETVSLETVQKCIGNISTSLEYDKFVCYAKVYNNIAIAVVTDSEYPERVMLMFINKVADLYIKESVTDFMNILLEYQDPTKVDKIFAIRSELDETIQVCRETVNKLLLREDELNNLIAKTDDLLISSNGFRRGAEDLNSCCIII